MFASDLLAVSASICIAFSSMLVVELNGRVDVFRLSRWNMVSALVMTGTVSLVLGGWRTLDTREVGLLAASSLFGIIIASTTYYMAIYAAGPRTTALLFSLTSPFALALGYAVLGEKITARQGLGIALVLCGIVLAIRGRGAGRPAPPAATSAAPWVGVALGVVTALGQAIGSLLARPAMAAGVEPFTAMAVRAGVAATFFLAITILPIAVLHRPYRFAPRDLGTAVTASFFGTGLGMSLLMAALAQGPVGTVSTLSSITPVVILPMVWIRTRIAPPRLAWIGAALAVAGTALISL
ncbi:MAG TPA: DMT family transporter [Stellaceae bacterium]|nr:DMT family transporter [Stellaceae bacterium]